MVAELKFDNEKNELLIEDLTRKLTYTEEELARLTLEMPQSAQEMKVCSQHPRYAFLLHRVQKRWLHLKQCNSTLVSITAAAVQVCLHYQNTQL